MPSPNLATLSDSSKRVPLTKLITLQAEMISPSKVRLSEGRGRDLGWVRRYEGFCLFKIDLLEVTSLAPSAFLMMLESVLLQGILGYLEKVIILVDLFRALGCSIFAKRRALHVHGAPRLRSLAGFFDFSAKHLGRWHVLWLPFGLFTFVRKASCHKFLRRVRYDLRCGMVL